jgi:predicted lysophospholipase L1 biosynthesis ABC-type transport system permease subunit
MARGAGVVAATAEGDGPHETQRSTPESESNTAAREGLGTASSTPTASAEVATATPRAQLKRIQAVDGTKVSEETGSETSL